MGPICAFRRVGYYNGLSERGLFLDSDTRLYRHFRCSTEECRADSMHRDDVWYVMHEISQSK